MAQLYSVQDVSFHINKSNPASLVVFASGLASSSGWSDAALVQRQYVSEPADGIQDFDFVGEPPTGISLMVLSPISGTGEIQLETWMKGVRVHSASNEMSVLLANKVRSIQMVE